jgi:hypothetical protein
MLKELPWNWDEVILATKDGRTEFDENDLIIQKVDNNTIKIAKIKFRIDSVIFEDASAEEILEGYNELTSFCDVIRVIELLVKSMVTRANGQTNIEEIEPEVLDFVKICYWYIQIKRINTLKHRRKEVRTRLCAKLLFKLEKSKGTLEYSNLEDEIEPRIEETLKQIRLETSQNDRDREPVLLNEYLNFISVCISELMFSALANKYNYQIDFSPGNNNYDYDVIINGRPSQVKTLFAYNIFRTRSEVRKQEKYIQEKSKVIELYNNNQLTFDLVKQKIVQYIKTDGIHKINEALRQKAEIVILDGSRTIPGLYLDYYYTDDSKYVKIYDSLRELMKPLSNGFINVLYVSTSYDVKFRISSLVIKVPVLEVLQVNERERDKISCVG